MLGGMKENRTSGLIPMLIFERQGMFPTKENQSMNQANVLFGLQC